MEKLRTALEAYLEDTLFQMVLSSPAKGLEESKVRIRPVSLKGALRFQAEIFRGTKVYHENYEKEEMQERVLEWMSGSFGQLQAQSAQGSLSVLVSKKGTVTVKEKRQDNSARIQTLTHNRKKRYLLEEGRPVDFLVDLGVMTREGKVVHARYDKFRQVNRFLEFIEDILPALPADREVTILDFGCGKSYLTFAMYYYLKMLRGLDIRIIGLDLKEDVIAHCAELSRKYGYEKLEFLKGDIAGYEGCTKVDMVVTLHACDTATDHALYKAVRWGAKVILCVPCCQHELNRQIQSTSLAPVLKYGLLKERMAALVTDGLRAELLEQSGYDVQVLEFIDMEHTPKNILIRAVKHSGKRQKTGDAYTACVEMLHVQPTLERLLEAGNSPADAYRNRRQGGGQQ